MKLKASRWLWIVLVSGLFVTALGGVSVKSVLAAYLLVDDTSTSGLVWTPGQSSWDYIASDKAIQGSIRRTCASSNGYTRAIEMNFTGSTVTYYYTVLPDGGVATVYIDNKKVDRIDQYSPEYRWQMAKTYTVANGYHTIKVENNYAEAGGNGRNCIQFDAFAVDTGYSSSGTYDNGYPPVGKISSASWTTYTASDAYGGSFIMTNVAEAGFRVNFVGDSIKWYFTKAYNRGQATVTIDGQMMSHSCDAYGYNCDIYWDLYDVNVLRGQSFTFSGLGEGVHHMTVTNYGINRFGSSTPSNNFIDVDRIDISNPGSPSYNRVMAAAYASGFARIPRNSSYINYTESNNCTNFSSQVLSAGTYPMIPGNYNRFDVNQWWYNSFYNPPNSNTWSATDWFYDFRGTRPTDFTIVTSLSSLRRGDLIVLDTDGDFAWDHMRVVSGWGYASPFPSDYSGAGSDFSSYHVYTLLTDANTVDRWNVQWNYNYVINPFLRDDFIHVID